MNYRLVSFPVGLSLGKQSFFTHDGGSYIDRLEVVVLPVAYPASCLRYILTLGFETVILT